MFQQNHNIESFGEGSMLVEQRREDRSRMVYRLVHIEVSGDEGLARCRNISDHGMMLDLSMPVRIGATVKVAFSATLQCLGRVIWTRGSQCGIAFDFPIDATAVLRDSAVQPNAEQRGLRLKREVATKVRFDGTTHEAVSCDLSQYGMRIRHGGAFHSGLCVTVALGSGPERRGVVRWTKGDTADVVLLEPFSVTELGSVGALVAA